MRNEIMSAGQTQQRKILTANQAVTQNETDMADEPSGTRNNYLNTVLDGYQANIPKKVSKFVSNKVLVLHDCLLLVQVQRAGPRGIS